MFRNTKLRIACPREMNSRILLSKPVTPKEVLFWNITNSYAKQIKSHFTCSEEQNRTIIFASN
jgi:hypothetical protein